jgi:hypothetical protein
MGGNHAVVQRRWRGRSRRDGGWLGRSRCHGRRQPAGGAAATRPPAPPPPPPALWRSDRPRRRRRRLARHQRHLLGHPRGRAPPPPSLGSKFRYAHAHPGTRHGRGMASTRAGKSELGNAEGLRMAAFVDRLNGCGLVTLFLSFCGLFSLLLVVGVRDVARCGEGGRGTGRGGARRAREVLVARKGEAHAGPRTRGVRRRWVRRCCRLRRLPTPPSPSLATTPRVLRRGTAACAIWTP